MSSSEDDAARLRPGERPTLKTIARLTGLAVPTISRALNDAPDIGATTKARVREVARSVGYVTNRAGLRLRTGKTHALALVLPEEQDLMAQTSRLVSAITEEAQAGGYHVIITPVARPADSLRMVRQVVEAGIADGLILNQIQPRDTRIKFLMDRRIPFVTHGRTEWCDRHPYFDFDNETFGRIAVRRLQMRGRRRLLMLVPPVAQAYSADMIRGAKDEARRLGIRVEVMPGATTDDPIDMIEPAVRDACASFQPDGIIAATNAAAISAIAGLEAIGLEIGSGVDLLTKDPGTGTLMRLFRRNTLLVTEDVPRAGATLAKALIQAIEHPELPPIQGLDVPDESS
ncbi:substrate-binding domain-containing protein [Mesobacterium pallidum]|uniref:substrate-binding domain-containing protein n=1 Tax=Mesobacterium pallidum TaxID=2872037 RepID=UPI001EE1EC21|nr:substrate-binding domain-containing protein [Mesobacterium pallidum]